MASYVMPLCGKCQHFLQDADTLACRAYPDGIPQEILKSEVDHRQPYAGDHGIQFDLLPNEDPPMVIKLVFDKQSTKVPTA